MYQCLKLTTTVLIVRKHVEASTCRRQQHNVTRRCPLRRKIHSLPQGARLGHRGDSLPSLSQNRRRLSDQNHPRDPPADLLCESRKIAALIPSAGDEPNRLIDTLQRFERGIDIRTLRIVHKSHPPTLADDFKGMFESGKRREDATN